MAIFQIIRILISTLATLPRDVQRALRPPQHALADNAGTVFTMLRVAEDTQAVGTSNEAVPAESPGEHNICDEEIDPQLRETEPEIRAALVESEAELALMRIECDELRAQVERLEAHREHDNEADTGEASATGSSAAPDNAACANTEHTPHPDDVEALRACLTRRERTALDLKKRLKQSEQRVRELKLTLRSWKHRVAPLAQQLNLQRELIRELRGRDQQAGESQDSENTLQ
jgi:chromosome segregation ATPase